MSQASERGPTAMATTSRHFGSEATVATIGSQRQPGALEESPCDERSLVPTSLALKRFMRSDFKHTMSRVCTTGGKQSLEAAELALTRPHIVLRYRIV